MSVKVVQKKKFLLLFYILEIISKDIILDGDFHELLDSEENTVGKHHVYHLKLSGFSNYLPGRFLSVTSF